jgi:hypothetical protein
LHGKFVALQCNPQGVGATMQRRQTDRAPLGRWLGFRQSHFGVLFHDEDFMLLQILFQFFLELAEETTRSPRMLADDAIENNPVAKGACTEGPVTNVFRWMVGEVAELLQESLTDLDKLFRLDGRTVIVVQRDIHIILFHPQRLPAFLRSLLRARAPQNQSLPGARLPRPAPKRRRYAPDRLLQPSA